MTLYELIGRYQHVGGMCLLHLKGRRRRRRRRRRWWWWWWWFLQNVVTYLLEYMASHSEDMQSQLFEQFAIHIFRVQYIWINILPVPGHTADMLASRPVIVLMASSMYKRYDISGHKYCGEKVDFV